MQSIWKSIATALLLIVIPVIDAWALSSNTTQCTDGSYTLTWSHSGPTDLYENKNGGGWTKIAGNVSSQAISGKSDGVYGYYVQTWIPDYVGMKKDKILGPISVTVANTPGVPSSLTIPNPPTDDNGGFNVSWGVSSGSVDEYELYIQENSGGWSPVCTTDCPGSRTKLVSGLGDATYKFRVRACNTEGSLTACSGYRTSGSVIVTIQPGSPSSITIPNPATDDNGAFEISWGASSGTVDEYELYQQKDGGSWTPVCTTDCPANRTKPVSGLDDGVYQFRARACNTESTFTACSGYRTSGSIIVANKPGVPSSITVPPSDPDGTFPVSWGTPTGNVDKYELYQQYESGNWNEVCLTDCPENRTETVTVSTEGTYLYRVRACNSVSTFTACSGYRTSTDVEYIKPPSIPSSITAPDLVNEFDVTWSASAGTVTRYNLQQKLNSDNWQTKQNNSSRTYPASGIESGNTYRFRVEACNDFYCSSNFQYSSEVYVLYPKPQVTLVAGGVSPNGQGIYDIGYDGVFTLAWSISGVFDSPTLKESEDGGYSWATLDMGGGTTLEFDKPGNYTAAPIEYTYELKACNIDGCGIQEITVSVLNYPRPGAPGLISIQSGPSTSGNYTLQWGASAGPFLEDYFYGIQERELGEPTWGAELNLGQVLEKSYGGKINGKTYEYQLRTCNTPEACSGYTAPFSVYVPYAKPSVPDGFTIDQPPTYLGNFELSWDDSTGKVDNYEIEHKPQGGNWSSYSAPIASQESISSAPSGNNEFRVKACNVDNCSNFSTPYSVYVPFAPPGTPGNVHLSMLPTSDGKFTVAWDEPSGRVDTYTVQTREGTTGSWSTIPNVTDTEYEISEVTVGDHQVRVMACNVDNCGEYTAEFTITVPNADWAELAGQGFVIPDEDLILPNLFSHQNVGAVAGEGGVSGGSASYQIPIQLPPGRNGMQPKVSISYSSQKSNGTLGIGWSLNTSSAISRCGQTVANDGRNLAVQYDADNDRLCLDGQRLMAVSGSYGASGTEYRTEIESFTRITQNGGLNGGSTWFKAELKNGNIRYYGYDAASRHKADGITAVKSWALTREEDRTSTANSIIYKYTTHGKGEHLLSDIYYTGSGGTSGNRRIEFTYETRNDIDSGYMAGGLSERTKRLEKITTYAKGTQVREYSLGYHYSGATGRSLVDWVQECGYKDSNQVCLPKTTFDWQDDPIEYGEPEPLKLDGQEIFADVVNIEKIVPQGDIDGNGSTDFPGYNTNAEQEIVGTNTLTGYETCYFERDEASYKCVNADIDLDGKVDAFKVVGNFIYFDFSGNSEGFVPSEIYLKIDGSYSEKDILLDINDMNGDGFSDIIINRFNLGKSKIQIYFHSGNVLDPYDGQNFTTIYELSYRNNWPSETSPVLPNESVSIVGDIDGNGLADFAVSKVFNEGIYGSYPAPVYDKILLNHSSPSINNFSVSTLPSFSYGNDLVFRVFNKFIDVNGDSLPDLLAWHEGITSLFVNVGGGNFSERIPLNEDAQFEEKVFNRAVGPGATGVFIAPKYAEYFKVQDIDGDGKFELLVPGDRIITGCAKVYDPRDSLYHNICGDELHKEIGVVVGSMYPEQFINTQFYDDSIYAYKAIFFKQNVEGVISTKLESTGLIGSGSQMQILDIFGDGLDDILFNYGGRYPGIRETDPNWIQNPGSSMLGTNYGAYVIRNYGSGNATEGYKSYDVMVSAETAMGHADKWTYRPLSSGDPSYHSTSKPFYEPDFDYLEGMSAAAREDHFHFTSSMYVVAEHKQSNGIGGLNSREYRYKGALYNNKGRGLQGFRTIIVEDLAADIEIQQDFHQIFPLAGKAHRVQKWEIGDRSSDSSGTDAFEETLFEWQIWPDGGHGSPVPVADPTDSWTIAANEPYFVGPLSQQTTRRTLARSGGTRTDLFTTMESNTFDRWGNLVTATSEYAEPGNSHIVSSTAATQYAAADTTNWWLNKPSRRTVTKHAVQNRAGVSIEPNTDMEQSVVVDFLEWDSGSRKPKRVKTSPSTGKFTEVISEFNANGLVSSLTVNGEGEVNSRTTTTTYSSDGYFPKTVTNLLDHTVTSQTNPKYGTPDTVTDPNGLLTSYEYDAFGRLIKGVAPNRNGMNAASDAHTSYQWCDTGTCSGVTHAVYRATEQQAGTPTKVTYFDSKGRGLRQDIQAFDGSDWIVTKTEYDELGRTVFESVPHYLSSPNSYGTSYPDFDLLGRPLQKVVDQTNGQVLDAHYTHEQGAKGFSTEIQVNNRSMSRTYNGLDQLIETVDALSGKTQYAYDGAGNPIVIQDANSNRILAKYNALGLKDWVDDPNMGLKSFTYTGFGEVETETDANMDVTSYEYDDLGRLETRSVNGNEEASWIFDTAVNGVGLLHMESRADSALVKTYTYDSLSRPTEVITTIDGEDFIVASHFDSNYGRPKGLSYPTGLTLHYGYSSSGYRSRTSNAVNNYTYREITDMDARGQWTEATLAASNYEVSRAFYRETGQMEGTAFDSLVQPHQTVAYTYDDFGNLSEQTVFMPSETVGINTENYFYDALNRLYLSSRTDGPDINYDYDTVGNLLKKDDFATSYSYTGGSGGPNAVKSVMLTGGGTKTYGYDANGNRTHEDGVQQLWYNAFNKPTRINRNETDISFYYGADQMRYKQVNQVSGKSTLYVDKLFEYTTKGGETQYRHFIGEIATLTIKEDQSGITPSIAFAHRDRLGSTIGLADEGGNLRESHSFDPFGKPRLGNILDKISQKLESLYTTRGFTDHEHLDDVKLIHMNGRAYDYNLGRFLSVDPVIQSPGNSQSLNPYSYIMNNPLAGKDPSGYASVLPSELVGRAKAKPKQPPPKARLAPGTYRHSVGNGYTVVYGSAKVDISSGADGKQKVSLGGVDIQATEIGSRVSINLSEFSGQSGVGAPDSGGHGANIGSCASEGKCHPGDFSDKEKAGIQGRTDNQTSDLRSASYGSMESALEALQESGVPKLANEYGLEFWAQIDGKTYEIYRVSTGFDKGFAFGAGNIRNTGDIIWHTHPSGKDVWAGDLEAAISNGASWVFASGKRLTGIQNPNFKDPNNPSQYRFKEMGGMKTRALMYDGRWHNGTTTISPY